MFNLYQASRNSFNPLFSSCLEIKYSSIYDQDVKYRARQIAKWLANNLNKYELVIYKETFKRNVSFLIDSNDKKIIATVKEVQKKNKDVIFHTFDINCFLLAKSENLIADFHQEKEDSYTGYSRIICKTDEELALFYEQLNTKTLPIELKVNEYLLVQDKTGEIIDKYKYIGNNNYSRVLFNVL